MKISSYLEQFILKRLIMHIIDETTKKIFYFIQKIISCDIEFLFTIVNKTTLRIK